jgi:hypothetical protein
MQAWIVLAEKLVKKVWGRVGSLLLFSYIKDMKACEHKNTYVAVRHVSGLVLRKCRDCGSKVA